MSILTDIKRYAKSEEYKNILDKYKNKIDGIVSKILESFNEKKVNNTLKYSEKDCLFLKCNIYEKIIGDIKQENKGINYFKEYLFKKKKENIDLIAYSIYNENGHIRSHRKYTEIDFMIKEIQFYSEILEGDLQSVINSKEKNKVEKDFTVY